MIEWNVEPEKVDWMLDHLKNFWDGRLVSIAPTGFPAYGRLLHPAYALDGSLVRWTDIAAHNHVRFTPTSNFSYLILPESLPAGIHPWVGNPPKQTLERIQVKRLISLLTAHTQTIDTVSFALNADSGWDRRKIVSPGHSVRPVLEPIPPSVRGGFRMQIPLRNYIVYSGDLEDGLAWSEPSEFWWTGGQTPNFWWPQDHAWAVARDDLYPWSIVAGSPDLIGQLVRDTDLEVVAISEQDVLESTPSWLTAAIGEAVHDLLHQGSAVVHTTCGELSCRIAESAEHTLRIEFENRGWRQLNPERSDRSLEDQLTDSLSDTFKNRIFL